MKHLITTKTHGLLDYLTGFLLFASPWLFGFASGGVKMGIPIIVGAMIPIMSMFTRYEGGLIRVIPMRAHLAIDAVTGLFVASSPWIFAFFDEVYLPHALFGAFQFLTALLTDSKPFDHSYDPRRPIP